MATSNISPAAAALPGDTTASSPPPPPAKSSASWTLFLKELNRVIGQLDAYQVYDDGVLTWADALTDIVHRLLRVANLLYANSDRLKDMEFRRERQRAVSSLARLVYLAKLASLPFPPYHADQRTRKQALVLAQHVQYLVLMLDTHNVELDLGLEANRLDTQFPQYLTLGGPSAVEARGQLMTAIRPFKRSFVYLDRDEYTRLSEHQSSHIVKTVGTILNNITKDPSHLKTNVADLFRALGWAGQVLCLVEALSDTSHHPCSPALTIKDPTADVTTPRLPPKWQGAPADQPGPLTQERQRLYTSFDELLKEANASVFASDQDSTDGQALMAAVVNLLQASEELCINLKTHLTDNEAFRYLEECFQYQLASSQSLRHTPLALMRHRLDEFGESFARTFSPTQTSTDSGLLDSLAAPLPQGSPVKAPATGTPPQDDPTAASRAKLYNALNQSVASIPESLASYRINPDASRDAITPDSASEDHTEKKSTFGGFSIPFIRRMRSRPELALTESLQRKRWDSISSSHSAVLPSPDSPLLPADQWGPTAQASPRSVPTVALPPPPLPEIRRMRSDAGFSAHATLVNGHTNSPTARSYAVNGVRVQRQRSLDALSVHQPTKLRQSLPGVQEEDEGPSGDGRGSARPWYMAYDHTYDDLTVNDQGQIVTGTLEALVERLTLHDCSVDSEFISTFLLTFRSFCSPQRFVSILIARFQCAQPEDLSDVEAQQWQQKKQLPIRLRVINVIKAWLESYFFDDEDASCVAPLREFVENVVRANMASSATRLLQLLDAKAETVRSAPTVPTRQSKSKSIDRMLAAAYASLPDTPPPSPRLDRAVLANLVDRVPIPLYDINPVEVARQLTIMDCRLFCAIRPHELIGQEFSKKDLSMAVNVRSMTARSTRITAWVVVSILADSDVKRRAMALKYFLKVADTLQALHNYNTLMAVVCGLNYSMVSRLHLTWKCLATKYASLMKTLDPLTDPDRNFAVYRSRIRNLQPPCLPFLGLYLTDLTFTDDGNQTYRRPSCAMPKASTVRDRPMSQVTLVDGGAPERMPASSEPKAHINFGKYMQTVRIIKEVQKFQVPYNLMDVAEVQRFLLEDIERTYAQWNPDALYQRSLRLEPRKGASGKSASLLGPQGNQSTSSSFLSHLSLNAATFGLPGSGGGASPAPNSRTTLEVSRTQSAQSSGAPLPRASMMAPTLTSSKSAVSLTDFSRVMGAPITASSAEATGQSPPTPEDKQRMVASRAATSVISTRGLASTFL
ncbi:hypothetical protein H4R34_000316 [Dimargaris verticillata]|uniref:Ras guanine nucleotide exchange factor domain-containing protein n=1 Tax=Dimargaris verticillata TaxID=2761393 RepID=A0A9W8EBZ6_9FUNG|nr:hypothetical protein H4R34_000316 [Dimargaris verticillata]